MQKYRHELKYPVSAGQLVIIKSRLANLVRPDKHAGTDGSYSIRSLYFDDYYNSCYYENENGTDPREKFRIRIYNHSADRITLECKRKERGKTLKRSCPLTEEQTRLLMAGREVPDIESQPPLLRYLTLEMRTRRLRPVVIVEYDRIPYVYKDGNVRITLDTNVCSSTDIAHFLDARIVKRPVMPVGRQLMEVKYDEFLPDFIYRSLQLNDIAVSAFSKYYLCRRFAI